MIQEQKQVARGASRHSPGNCGNRANRDRHPSAAWAGVLMASADVVLISASAVPARADLKFIGWCGLWVLRVPDEHTISSINDGGDDLTHSLL